MPSGDGKGGMKGVLAPEGLSYNMLDIQGYICASDRYTAKPRWRKVIKLVRNQRLGKYPRRDRVRVRSDYRTDCDSYS